MSSCLATKDLRSGRGMPPCWDRLPPSHCDTPIQVAHIWSICHPAFLKYETTRSRSFWPVPSMTRYGNGQERTASDLSAWLRHCLPYDELMGADDPSMVPGRQCSRGTEHADAQVVCRTHTLSKAQVGCYVDPSWLSFSAGMYCVGIWIGSFPKCEIWAGSFSRVLALSLGHDLVDPPADSPAGDGKGPRARPEMTVRIVNR